MFSFDIGTDFLGLGQMVAGATQAKRQGTSECGAKPACKGNGANCKRQWEMYDRCTLAAINSKANIENTRTTTMGMALQRANEKVSFKHILLGLGVIVVVFFIVRSKR